MSVTRHLQYAWNERRHFSLLLPKAAVGLVTAMVAASNATNPQTTAQAKPVRVVKQHRSAQRAATTPKSSVLRTIVGSASWYGPGFHGRRTASGEIFNRNRSTIASRSLPFGTNVRVTYLRTGKSEMARVTDRGPYVGGRVVDLSEGLARRIGLRSAGHGRVKVEVLGRSRR